MASWLIKSEPATYSWEQLVADKRTEWDGIRNYQARRNLQAMKKGDLCLFYHSNQGLEVVGIARVVRESYPDPTTDDQRWVAVDVVPVRKLPKPVPLSVIKTDTRTRGMKVVRQGRLSVSPVTEAELAAVLDLAGEKSGRRPRRRT